MSNDLIMERMFAVPPRAVYDAFLGMYGENRQDWIVESRLDLRPGGTWRVVFHPPGLEAFTEDRVLSAVEPPHRLAYSMTAIFPRQPRFSTEVELTFAPEGAGTRLVLTQRSFPDAATRDDFAGGWSGVWDMLTPGEHETGSAG
ncbi:MAG: SRPBCC family protein [Sciscionella sp.]